MPPRPPAAPAANAYPLPSPYPHIERPLPVGWGVIDPAQYPQGQTNWPQYRYPTGEQGHTWDANQWFDQFQSDYELSQQELGTKTKLALADLYRNRGVPIPSKKDLTSLFGRAARRRAGDMVMELEENRAYGNLGGGMQVLADQGTDYLNDYLNHLSHAFAPGPPSDIAPGGTGALPIPGGLDPAALLNLGTQYLMGQEIGILPGLNVGGGGQSMLPGILPNAGGQ